MDKKCFTCNKYLPSSEFHKDIRNRDGLNSNCKPCRSLSNKKWWQLNRKKNKKIKLIYTNKEMNFIKIAIKNIFKYSRMFPKPRGNYHRKGWVPEITLEEMYEELLLHMQLMKDKFPETNGKLCRYCEQPWTSIRKGSKKEGVVKSNFSVDRFDTNKTYMKGNVIFCCAKCNSTKKDSAKKDWLKYLEIDKEIHEENKTI
jgi:hypothetical protein